MVYPGVSDPLAPHLAVVARARRSRRFHHHSARRSKREPVAVGCDRADGRGGRQAVVRVSVVVERGFDQHYHDALAAR